MQSVPTYSPTWQQVSPFAAPRSGVVAYLRALTVPVLFGSMVANFWWRGQWDWTLDFAMQGINVRDHYLIGFLVVLTGHLTLGLRDWFAAPFQVMSSLPGKLFTLFCVLELMLAPLSESMRTSAVYAGATWLVFVCCHLYWNSDYTVVRRVLDFSGLMLIGWLVALTLHLGLSRFGSIGGINRNTISQLGLAAMICCQLSPRRAIRWAGIGSCAAIAVAITSRGTIVAMGVFVAIDYVLHKGTTKAVAHAMLSVFLITIVLLASTFLKQYIVEGVLRLHDKDRGLGTGFTGRMETWKEGLETFWESPLIGHGFRAIPRGALPHSGYLTLLVETGMLGTFVAVAAVVVQAIQRLKLAQQFRNASPAVFPGIDLENSLRVNAVACATMCTILTLWVYEPLYLNLGTVISAMFFLMFGAPEFIPHRRSTIPM